MVNKIREYFRLSKFFLSAAIAVSSTAGFLLSELQPIHHLPLLICGVFFLSGGSAVFNQIMEMRTDSLMDRTRRRPLPSGKIGRTHAMIFGILMSSTGAIMLLSVNLFAFLLGLANFVIYVFLYTPLKYRTPLSLPVGAVIGAIPPLIGWYAAGNQTLSLTILTLSLFIYLWQIPHFLILYFRYSREYENAGIAAPVSNSSSKKQKMLLIRWMLLVSASAILFAFCGITDTWQVQTALFVFNLVAALVFVIQLVRSHDRVLKSVHIQMNIYLLLTMFLIAALKLI